LRSRGRWAWSLEDRKIGEYLWVVVQDRSVNSHIKYVASEKALVGKSDTIDTKLLLNVLLLKLLVAAEGYALVDDVLDIHVGIRSTN
jgi:hypothetical protein